MNLYIDPFEINKENHVFERKMLHDILLSNPQQYFWPSHQQHDIKIFKKNTNITNDQERVHEIGTIRVQLTHPLLKASWGYVILEKNGSLDSDKKGVYFANKAIVPDQSQISLYEITQPYDIVIKSHNEVETGFYSSDASSHARYRHLNNVMSRNGSVKSIYCAPTASENKTLSVFFTDNLKYDVLDRLKLSLELLNAANEQVTKRGFVHRALNPENVLFSEKKSDFYRTFKVTIQCDAAIYSIPKKFSLRMTPFFKEKTAKYLAPETIYINNNPNKTPPKPYNDIYSLGKLLEDIWCKTDDAITAPDTGNLSNHEEQMFIKSYDRLFAPSFFTKGQYRTIFSLIKQMTNDLPKNRPTIERAINIIQIIKKDFEKKEYSDKENCSPRSPFQRTYSTLQGIFRAANNRSPSPGRVRVAPLSSNNALSSTCFSPPSP